MADPSPILVTGGSGTLGRAFAEAAEAEGRRVRILSRRPAPEGLPDRREWARGDLRTGEGLDRAVRDAGAVLHAATDPEGDPRAVDVDGTRRLLEAAGRAGVAHFVYPSIVGIDRMSWAYYDAKVEAERLVRDAGLPHTIVRITQFHSFVDRILSRLARLPFVLALPTKARLQSIHVDEAASHLLERVVGAPSGRIPDVAGPEVLELGDMARAWCRARGERRTVVRLPVPGALARGFREGRATVPERAFGSLTWEEWLRRRYGA